MKQTIKAAGGILWRADSGSDNGGVEVAVIHRPRYDDWSFPKGKLVHDETFLEGAVREVAEETGYRFKLGRPLGDVSYIKTSESNSRPKVVRYWAMQAEGGVFTPGNEVDQLRWLPLQDAAAHVTHDRDREVLERFAAGPTVTRTVLIVRHATAGTRQKWKGDDRERPLDSDGARQAEELVWLLTRWDVREVVSADYVRCVQTVEPLAAAVGLSIALEPALSEDAYEDLTPQALELARTCGSDHVATVFCTQGAVIPDLLERLAREDGVALPEDLAYKKGSVWALTFDGKRLVTCEYFPPPV